MNMDEKDKKVYELALLVKNESDIVGPITLLKQHNGELVSEPRAKKLALAYEIKGETEAVFASCMFRASGEDAKNLEHDMNTRGDVLRFLILIAPAQSERQPSPASFPSNKRGRPMVSRPSAPMPDVKAPSRPLSNEALEKKIEEILK